MAYPAGAAAYRMAFEISPISLSGGIAQGIPGGMLPIMSVLQSPNFSSILSGGDLGLDDAFAYFHPLPGGSLIKNQIGSYPFANMSVAANCIIAEPLTCSLLMRCPVRDQGGYATKLAIMTSLKNTLDQHNRQGGTYNVATPFFFYTDLILLDISDVSGGESMQAQTEWKWDFVKPLITQSAASGAQNAMMSKLSSGVATDGALSGNSVVLGNPQTATSSGVLPSSAATPSAGVPSSNGYASQAPLA